MGNISSESNYKSFSNLDAPTNDYSQVTPDTGNYKNIGDEPTTAAVDTGYQNVGGETAYANVGVLNGRNIAVLNPANNPTLSTINQVAYENVGSQPRQEIYANVDFTAQPVNSSKMEPSTVKSHEVGSQQMKSYYIFVDSEGPRASSYSTVESKYTTVFSRNGVLTEGEYGNLRTEQHPRTNTPYNQFSVNEEKPKTKEYSKPSASNIRKQAFMMNTTFNRAKIALDNDNQAVNLSNKTVNYKIQAELGSGAYKTAYKVTNMNKTFATEKVITYPQVEHTSAEDKKEAQINQYIYGLSKTGRQKFNHVMVATRVTVPGSTVQGYKSEYAKGGNVDSRLANLSAKDKQVISVGMIASLKEMQLAGLFHRDLKADNFVIMDDPKDGIKTVKLVDMGKATQMTNPSVNDNTVIFGLNRPPETWVNGDIQKNDLSKYDARSEIYQLGMALWQVHCGIASGENGNDLRKGMSDEYGRLTPASRANTAGWQGMAQLDDDKRECIIKMRDPDPSKRPTLDEVMAVFGDSQKVINKG